MNNVNIPLAEVSIPSVTENSEELANIFTKLSDFPGIPSILNKLKEMNNGIKVRLNFMNPLASGTTNDEEDDTEPKFILKDVCNKFADEV